MQTTELFGRGAPVIGDQRPPKNAALPRASAPKSALRKVRTQDGNAALVEALGWFSVGLGVAQLAAPRAVSRLIGAPQHSTLMRFLGLRELACGAGLLSGGEPQAFLWARVAGDLMDLAMLANTLRTRASVRGIGAITAVIGATAIDIYAADNVRKAGMPESVPRDRMVRVEKNLATGRSPDECYAMWRKFENFPRFMRFVESVTTSGDTRSHWVARTPLGAKLEWDAEITNDQPGKLIAWRSVDEADVEHAGVVRFEPGRDGRGTWLRVEIQYLPPGGALGAMLANMLSAAPSDVIEEDVRRFKRLIETGEVPTIEGQSHGKRSLGYQLLRKGRA